MPPDSPTLAGLPVELQLGIIDRLSRPSDLGSIRSTASWLRALASPLLYSNVTLDLNKLKLPDLNGFSNAEHPARIYVRSLDFKYNDKPQREDPAGALRIALAIIELLPRDTLTDLEIPETLSVDAAFLCKLFSRQSEIETLWLHPQSSALMEVFAHPSSSDRWLTTITDLELPSNLHCLEQLQGYNEIIRRAASSSQLQTLRLSPSSKSEDPLQLDHLHDQPNAPRLLFSTLFSHIAPFGLDTQPLQLNALYLDDVDLTFADQSLLRVVDFSNLSYLDISFCTGAQAFLGHLNRNLPPGPCCLRYFHFVDLENAVSVDTLDIILGRCQSIRELVLRYYNNENRLPTWSSIVQSRRRLQVLSIFTESPGPEPRLRPPMALPLRRLQELARDFLMLKELAIGFPAVSFVRAGKPQHPDLVESLEAAAAIPALRALRILNWPSVPPDMRGKGLEFDDTNGGECARLLYKELLQDFASCVMKTIASVRTRLNLAPLRALCIGEPTFTAYIDVSGATSENHPRRTTFVPIWERGFCGEAEIIAKAVSKVDLQFDDQSYCIIHDFRCEL